MPDLRRALADHDLALLQVIAEQWQVVIPHTSQREALEALADQLAEPERLRAGVADLPLPAQQALAQLQTEPHRQPVATFTRRYGELRAMGTTRRQREQPWRNAPSTTETLWYRGLIGRGFFDAGRGPEEFIYLPSDLAQHLHLTPPSAPAANVVGQPVLAPATFANTPGYAHADLVTLLAYVQTTTARLEGQTLAPKNQSQLQRFLHLPAALPFYLHFAQAWPLLTGPVLRLQIENVKNFLENTPNPTAQLAALWRDSTTWNDLRQIPGLVFEGQAWHNDPLLARTAILKHLAAVPAGTWWSLASFVAAIKEHQPDFQRPGGDYDSWYIRDAATQAYLRGFEHWDQVDGALIRWVILHPLHWLGLVDVGGVGEAQAFCVTSAGEAFLAQAAQPAPQPAQQAVEAAQPVLSPEGVFTVPWQTNASVRFRIARIAQWHAFTGESYIYHLTPLALAHATKKGLTLDKIFNFLDKTLGSENIPPNVRTALQHWEQHGGVVAVRDVAVLIVKNAQVMQTLRNAPVLRPLLGPALGPTAITVPREHLPQLRAALLAMGILPDE